LVQIVTVWAKDKKPTKESTSKVTFYNEKRSNPIISDNCPRKQFHT
jgi:hypothetical protein